MYKNLKFSWAHILAFLAVIFIGYVSFVGLTYMIDDGFIKPSLYTFIIILILLVWFIGAQQLKGVDNNFSFKKCIIAERFLIATCPLIFVVCMIPLNHAFLVSSQSERIETTFKEAIKSSTKMFEDYDIYSKDRISNYKDCLIRVKDNRNIKPSVYDEIGFSGKNDDKKVALEVQILTKQLTANYDSLRIEANQWINSVDRDANVWNVFFIGNVKEIKMAIVDWRNQMVEVSGKILKCEIELSREEVQKFDANDENIEYIVQRLDGLSEIYKNAEGLSNSSIIIGVILFILLLFPYFIQSRNGVSTYKLFGRRFMDNQGGIYIGSSNSKKKRANLEINLEDNNTHREKKTSKIRTETSSSSDLNISMVIEDDDEEMINRVSKEERRRERQRKRRERQGIDDSSHDEYSQRRKRHNIDKDNDDDDDFEFSTIDHL